MALNLDREWETGASTCRRRCARSSSAGAATRRSSTRECAPAARVVESLAELFAQRYDAIITPAAPGTAPKGLEATGDPSFCTLWTLCGMPALNVPLMRAQTASRSACSSSARAHGDARLLRTARWLVNAVGKG